MNAQDRTLRRYRMLQHVTKKVYADDSDHYFSSYWLTQRQPQFKLLILWADRLLMTDSFAAIQILN